MNCRRLGNAAARFADGILTVETGCLRRSWRWTGRGFRTVEFTDQVRDFCWPLTGGGDAADWVLPPPQEGAAAELRELSIREMDDEGFTTPTVEVIAEILVPAAGIELRWRVWAWPDAPGLRTQLAIRAVPDGARVERRRMSGRAEYLPLDPAGLRRRLIGYRNDTQNRNDIGLDLLKEDVVTAPVSGPEFWRWPSAICLERPGAGLALVQESHKCPNQGGLDCGLFRLSPALGLEADGWGVPPLEWTSERWLECWGYWTFVYDGSDLGRQLAFTRMDRTRFPFDSARDLYSIANTWGSTRPGPEAKNRAREDNVLTEIASAADLGIDVQQIDDGWQGDQYERWQLDPQRWPRGWQPAVDAAREAGIRLGLWAAAQPVGLDDLKAAWDAAGFRQYKLDFVRFRTRAEIDDLIAKIRAFVQYTGHHVRANWDTTEVTPRFGYWFAREYGALHTSNRKPLIPVSTAYRPPTVLRDAWQMARYLNLRRFQIPINRAAAIDPAYSEASQYPQGYCVALTLMGIPLFFMETQHLERAERAEVRAVLRAWKSCREDLAACPVLPLGECPDHRSWTGFQAPRSDGGGYLLLCREAANTDERGVVRLPARPAARLEFEDLMNGRRWEFHSGPGGEFPWHFPTAPAFAFCRYRPA